MEIDNNKDKVLYLVSHYPDPLINRRLEMLKKKFQVAIFYSLRNNEKFQIIENVEYFQSKNDVINKNLIKRLIWILKEIKEIKRIIKKYNPQYIYAFGLDMLFLVSLTGNKKRKIIYDVVDLHDIIINDSKSLKKKIIKRIITFLEKKCCKNVELLTITSEKFYDIYFKNMIDRNKVYFIPNMPDLKYFKDYKKIKNDIFTVGYIGGVRYKEQMKMLIKAAEELPIKVFFAGFSQDNEIENLVKNKDNIEYYGRYNYNTEIADLYSKCDCVYSVYDVSMNNVKYALPNKLYESIYCELPIMVADNTYLGELVKEWGVGLTVNSKSLEDLKEKIKLLMDNKEVYDKIVDCCINNKEKINIDRYNMKFIEMMEKK